jgi:hypothetical protein
MRGYIYPKLAASFILTACLMFQACGAGTLSKLHDGLNKAAKSLNAAAKTNHQFYESGIYGPVGSEQAIHARQAGAKAIGAANDKLIIALGLAQSLTAETFQQGKLAVLATLAEAVAQLKTGNQNIDLVLAGVATIINSVVVLVQSFQARDLPQVLPIIKTWQLATVEV